MNLNYITLIKNMPHSLVYRVIQFNNGQSDNFLVELMANWWYSWCKSDVNVLYHCLTCDGLRSINVVVDVSLLGGLLL